LNNAGPHQQVQKHVRQPGIFLTCAVAGVRIANDPRSQPIRVPDVQGDPVMPG
jgi:hypothetical protein